jgi:hypothetical protein
MDDEIIINLRALTEDDREKLLFLLNNSTFLIPDDDNVKAIETINIFTE